MRTLASRRDVRVVIEMNTRPVCAPDAMRVVAAVIRAVCSCIRDRSQMRASHRIDQLSDVGVIARVHKVRHRTIICLSRRSIILPARVMLLHQGH
jgi:hypothetical protein